MRTTLNIDDDIYEKASRLTGIKEKFTPRQKNTTDGPVIKKELIIQKYVRYLFLAVFMAFLLNKFYFRPFVLKNDYPELFKIVVLSLPNFSEAVMGILLLTGILFQLRSFFDIKLKFFKTSYVYSTALILAAIYVIAQEFGIHNLGGNNVFDPYDLTASIMGLSITYITILKFGFIEKQQNL